jgi:acylphosphatase
LSGIYAYSSDVEGGAPVVQRFTIHGRFDTSFLDFISERAGWLSLSGWARHMEPGRVDVVAAGPEALVGALEMACTLGPLNALVESVTTRGETGAVAPGFLLRR